MPLQHSGDAEFGFTKKAAQDDFDDATLRRLMEMPEFYDVQSDDEAADERAQ